jgi:hypothetical protein
LKGQVWGEKGPLCSIKGRKGETDLTALICPKVAATGKSQRTIGRISIMPNVEKLPLISVFFFFFFFFFFLFWIG